MSYSISEVAKMLNVSTYTIRYYDKEGLFPLVKRVNGIRVFEDKDFPWLRMLNCLKNLNMPIKKIKEYVDLALKGDETLKERIRRYVKRHYTLEYEDKRMEHRKSIVFAFLLLLSGLIILTLHFLFTYTLSDVKSAEPFNELTT